MFDHDGDFRPFHQHTIRFYLFLDVIDNVEIKCLKGQVSQHLLDIFKNLWKVIACSFCLPLFNCKVKCELNFTEARITERLYLNLYILFLEFPEDTATASKNSFSYGKRHGEKKANISHSAPDKTVNNFLEGTTLFFGHKLVLNLTQELVRTTTSPSKKSLSKQTRLAPLA